MNIHFKNPKELSINLTKISAYLVVDDNVFRIKDQNDLEQLAQLCEDFKKGSFKEITVSHSFGVLRSWELKY